MTALVIFCGYLLTPMYIALIFLGMLSTRRVDYAVSRASLVFVTN
jgi:hypothetical protein